MKETALTLIMANTIRHSNHNGYNPKSNLDPAKPNPDHKSNPNPEPTV